MDGNFQNEIISCTLLQVKDISHIHISKERRLLPNKTANIPYHFQSKVYIFKFMDEFNAFQMPLSFLQGLF